MSSVSLCASVDNKINGNKKEENGPRSVEDLEFWNFQNVAFPSLGNKDLVCTLLISVMSKTQANLVGKDSSQSISYTHIL